MPTFSSLPQCFRTCAAKTFSCKDSDVNCICTNYLNGGDVVLAVGCLLITGGDGCDATDLLCTFSMCKLSRDVY